ncbi:MAG: hypothetical protein ABI639_08990 [Thermoanaerobaculia bacterium]
MSQPGRPVLPAIRLAHYWWPVVMAWSLTVVLHHATGEPVSSAGLCLLLFGALAAYSMDRLIDGARALEPAWLRFVLGSAVGVAVLGALFLLPLLARWKVPLLLVLSGVAVAYPYLKRIYLAKTILVPLVWTVAVIALPASRPFAFSPVDIPLFLLVAAGCLLCDIKDAAEDSRRGIGTVPAILGVPTALALAATVAIFGAGAAWIEHRPGLLACGIALVAIAPCRRLISAEALGPLAVDAILTLPGLLIVTHLV